jgi:RHS repeat-associated protein
VQGADPQNPGTEILFQQSEYGEGQIDDTGLNLRTRAFKQFDTAGAATNEAYDFKGNLLRATREVAANYKGLIDWSVTQPSGELFSSSNTYDALNRLVTVTSPDNSIYRPIHNEANLLDQIYVNLQGVPDVTAFVTNIDYDAKGQREVIAYGNGAVTAYAYEPDTFRLSHLVTLRGGTALQDLHYTYDPAGNITHIEDAAQQTIYFKNTIVEPSADYTYDAIYRLIEATGREHLGQVGGAPIPHSYNDAPRVGLLPPGDGNAMGRYRESYQYDGVGNFLWMQHVSGSNSSLGWTRTYTYNETSLLELPKKSNRLSATNIGSGDLETYSYDAHGNMLKMPQLQVMQWDFKDQLQMSRRQAINDQDDDGTQRQGEQTFYVYDGSGQRTRKVTERQSGTRTKERIYVAGFEIYREYNGDGSTTTLERQTLHVMQGGNRIALVETRTDGALERTVRYQLANTLSSTVMELDILAQVISYEEYYPYGSTSYQAGRSVAEVSLKRYRYIGMERDNESGLEYHSTRYYAPWLGRWTTCDPASLQGGVNLYRYCYASPLLLRDAGGTEASIGDAGDLPETATLDQIKAYASAHGHNYWDPDNQRHYVMTEKGGQWKGGILMPRVYDPSTEGTGGFGQPSSEKNNGGDLSSVPTGPYSTNPNAGGNYDPLAPKTGLGGRGGQGSKGGQGGKRIPGPPGGTPKNGGMAPPPPNSAPPMPGGGGAGGSDKSGSGGQNEHGWGWLADVLETVLTVVMLAVVLATAWNFGAAFFAALSVEGISAGAAANIAAAEVMGVGTGTAAAGSLRAIYRGLTGGTQPWTRLYQLVDEQGDPVYIGESMDIYSRIQSHADTKEYNWRGLQIISDEFAKPNGLALEQTLSEGNEELILSRESGSLYKLGGNWDPSDLSLGKPIIPTQTFLNPRYYPSARSN